MSDLAIPFRTIAEAFADFAARHPDRAAITDVEDGGVLDFAALQDRTDRIAAALAARGIGTGDRVVILSDECIEKLLLFFAVWRVGGVACPFHIEMDVGHLQDIIRSIDPKLILWHADLDGPAIVGDLGIDAAPFGRDAGFLSGIDDADTSALAPVPYGPEDVGCIFSTSGTTDRPKCVVWDHLGLWLCGLSTLDFTGATADDRLLEYRTFSWLSPQIVALMPFVETGLSMYVARRFSQSRFFDWIRDNDITIVAGVPTVIAMLMARAPDPENEAVPSLRLMTSSSAPLSPDQWRAFEDRFDIRLLQFYGASEGGWHCGNRHHNRKVGTVGPPAKHIDLVVVDADGEECAPGAEGEITIRGPQTATAVFTSEGTYHDRTPYRLTKRERVGDLAVVDEDGFLTVTGRVKDLIIRGGANIAPLEVDRVVLQHPDIAEVATVGIPDEIYGEEVGCWVVPVSGAQPAENDIIAFCETRLPKSKAPKAVRITEALIKNDRGKIRREEMKSMWVAADG